MEKNPASKKVKVVYSEPEITYEKVTVMEKEKDEDGKETGKEYVKSEHYERVVDITNEQNCKRVEFCEVTSEIIDILRNSKVMKSVFSEEDGSPVIDLYAWREPNDTL